METILPTFCVSCNRKLHENKHKKIIPTGKCNLCFMKDNKIGEHPNSIRTRFQKGQVGYSHWLGKKFSEERKQKIREIALAKGFGKWMTGKKLSEDSIRKRSAKTSGQNSSKWKGGVTKLRHRIRNCFEYKTWRTKIFQRDCYSCVLCGVKGSTLNVDHYPVPYAKIIQDKKIDSLEKALKCFELWDLNNGRTLCIACHKKTQNYMKGR